MRRPVPDARYRLFLQAVDDRQPPDDLLALACYRAHTGHTPSEEHLYACELAGNPEDRDALVAFYLSGATSNETSESLGIPLAVLDIFGRLAIDMTVFRNKLELLRYVIEYKKTATETGSQLIDLGTVQGPVALMYHFLHGHEDLPIDSKNYARSMMNQAYYFSMTARGNSIKSGVSKEALRWLSATSNLMKDYERLIVDTHDNTEMMLAIDSVKSTYTAEELNLDPKTFMH